MSEPSLHRKLAANVCLYRELSARISKNHSSSSPSITHDDRLTRKSTRKRTPLFLHRNLTQVLDAHERALLLLRNPLASHVAATSTSPTGMPNLGAEASVASPALRGSGGAVASAAAETGFASARKFPRWEYPTAEMLRDLMRGQKPVLKLEGLQVRAVSAGQGWIGRPDRREVGADEERSDDGGDGLEWLGDGDVDLKAPCRVTVRICRAHVAGKEGADGTVYAQSRAGTMIGRKRDGNGPVYFDVEPVEPFLVELENFFEVKQMGSNGFRHWKWTETTRYGMEVEVQCSSSSVKVLREQFGIDDSGATDSKGMVLRASWANLPDCPRNDSLLPLVLDDSGKLVKMPKWGVDMAIGWTRRAKTPLEVMNRLQDPESCEQLPTPSSSEDHERAPKRIRVQYEYDEGMHTKAHTTDDMSCLFCQHTPYTDMRRLMLHYAMYHDHFRFELFEQQESEKQQRLSIRIHLADAPTGSASDGRYQQDWIAPDRPFDIAAHLAGDESWTGGSNRLAGKRGRGFKTKDADHSNEGSVAAAARSSARQNLAEVPDLAARPRKRHQAPDVPGVTFYHTISKQPIRTGEWVSEDEDDGVDERLTQSQRQQFRQLGLTVAEQAFHEAFNQHLDEEQSSSVVLMRPAMVRFVRKYKQRLKGEWKEVFEAKLRLLGTHWIVAEDVVEFCHKYLAESEDIEPTDAPGMKHQSTAANEEPEVEAQSDSSEDVRPGKRVRRQLRSPSKVMETETTSERHGTPALELTSVKKTSIDGSVASKNDSPLSLGTRPTAASTDRGTKGANSDSLSSARRRCFCGHLIDGPRGFICCDNESCVRAFFHMACVGLQQRPAKWLCSDCGGSREA